MANSNIGNPVLTLYEKVIEPVTDTLGIGYYDNPLRRFVVVTTAAALGLWLTKPSGLFDKDGNARPWTVTAANSNVATPVPWYVVAGLAGTFSVLFI
jgi:hypothetical protein